MSWPLIKLGDIVRNCSSKRIPLKQADRAERNGDYRYYGASGVIDYVDDYLFDGDYLLIGEDGNNLLSRSTPIAFHANGKFWVNNHAHVLSSNGKADLGFIAYYINSINLEAYITGSAQPKLNKSNLEAIKVPLPPLDEQKRIAAILDKADAIRRKRQQAIQLADDFLRSVFLDMFGDPVTNPKGWEVKSFSKVCKCSQGIQVDSELQKNSIENGYVKFLRIINYTQSSKEFKFIPAPLNDKALINQDEIVMVRYGATAGFVGRGLNGILANNLFKISFEKSVLDNEYFYYLLNSDYFQNILKNNKKGGAMPAISFGQLNDIKVMTPSLEIQSKFSRVVNVINNIKGGTLHSESLLNDSFNSLSKKAFSGEL